MVYLFNQIFEYDPVKSRNNFEKHGIDFEGAQAMWLDPCFIEVTLETADEKRYLIIGKIKSKVWAAIITYRGDRIRIISVRRARPKEASIYESEEGYEGS